VTGALVGLLIAALAWGSIERMHRQYWWEHYRSECRRRARERCELERTIHHLRGDLAEAQGTAGSCGGCADPAAETRCRPWTRAGDVEGGSTGVRHRRKTLALCEPHPGVPELELVRPAPPAAGGARGKDPPVPYLCQALRAHEEKK
jgi:hypothetical protein